MKLWTWFPSGTTSDGRRGLPRDWFTALDGWECLVSSGETMNAAERWRDYRSRREAEDAAALAFSKLSSERRTELLAAIPKKKPGARKPTARKPKGKK